MTIDETQFSPEADLSFRHLQLELARLDILLHRQIQRQRPAGPSEEGAESILSGYHMSEAQAYQLLQRPVGEVGESLSEEVTELYEQALAHSEAQIAALVEQSHSGGLRLHRLATLLDLDRFTLDVLLVTLAPLLDTRYGKLYGYLQDDLTRKRPTISLILDLLCPPQSERLLQLAAFTADGILFRHRLVERIAEPGAGRRPLIDEALAPNESIVTWLLLGQYQPDVLLKDQLSFQAGPVPKRDLLPAGIQEALAAAAADDTILVFHGRDHLSRGAAACIPAATSQRPLLTLDLAGAAQAEITARTALRLLLRDARLTGAIPHITGWDVCLTDDAPPPELLTALCRHPGLSIISGEKKWQPRHAERARRLRWFDFPIPDTGRRQQLLTHFLDGIPVAEALNVAGVAGQFLLTTGQLRDLVNSAQDMAAQDGRSLDSDYLYAAARAHSNPRLDSLAKKITPRYTWPDLVLPGDQITILHELVDTVRSRPLVLEQWGVGQKLVPSAGITALFFGPPGTGKTMAAEVLAGELGLDLYKIDLSSMVSKYIGETEKNLERIFSEAESSNAILFFDEADAIFGKRSEVKDAHDRYANIEISYLLQRMEAYNGITILATNMRANLDEAFMRRLQFALDFPFPKAEDRLHIWQTLFPDSVPRDPDLDFELLAHRFEIAGGNIRNIIVTAAYLAAANGQIVMMEHLMHSTRRELQKMGRLVNERDLEML